MNLSTRPDCSDLDLKPSPLGRGQGEGALATLDWLSLRPILKALLLALPLLTFPSLAVADFPTVYNSEADTAARPPTPQESLAKLALPPGFEATIFAAEPDVQNPIAMAWDARGRLWIAENYTYAETSKRFDLHLRDRILTFEDTDHDGHFDRRQVFTDDVQQLTSVEV